VYILNFCSVHLFSLVLPSHVRRGQPHPLERSREITLLYILISGIDFLLIIFAQLLGGGDGSAQAAQPNIYHSISLASGANVAQGLPFSGFSIFFFANIRQNSLDGGDRPVATALPTLQTAQSVMQHADLTTAFVAFKP
jgi:hypothetical protein